MRVGPALTNQPTNLVVRIRPDPLAAATTNATFTSGAQSYNPPVQYQWSFNGADILGATNPTYTVVNVQTTKNRGSYAVLVSDAVGSTISTQAYLYPVITPILTIFPVSISVVTGAVISLSAAASGNPLPFTWEWRRVNTGFLTNTTSKHYLVSFVNTNPVGSTIQYRVIVRASTTQANVLFNITTLADDDGDGIPDDWGSQFD